MLAFDEHSETETFLVGLGCKMMPGDDGKKRLICKDSLVVLKKAPLKLKGVAK